jgi:hypothetical protein
MPALKVPQLKRKRSRMQRAGDLIEQVRERATLEPVREFIEARRPRFCPQCGAVLEREFQPGERCPACNEKVAEIAHTPPGNESEAPEAEEKASGYDKKAAAEKLDLAIAKWAKKGFYIVRHKKNRVEMRKPKRFSKKLATAWLVAGIPLPGFAWLYGGGYAAYHVLRKDRLVTLEVGEDGELQEKEAAA